MLIKNKRLSLGKYHLLSLQASPRGRQACLQRPGLPDADVRAPALGRRRQQEPFWTLFMVYVIRSVGELCLSPIGLDMGGCFLSTGIGNNPPGIFASHVSGKQGMTTASPLSGYTFGFCALIKTCLP
jgi:hypothetical protein